MSIPKVIHYCWFGNKKKPQLVEDCISSWRKYLPDYEIIEWNERNTNLKHPFLKITYKLKKWAFVSDFVRLKILYEFGGIYLDTDMLILKSLDNFLEDKCFFGAENEIFINAAIIGVFKNHYFIKECLLKYENLNLNNETNWEEICIPRIITQEIRDRNDSDLIFKKKVEIYDIVIYPPSYFYPLNFENRKDIKNYKNYLKLDSHAVHLWSGSWIEPNEFHYLRNGQYSEGLRKVINNIATHKKIGYLYFKKILSSFKESLFNKK
ncbi:glycosyltransferase family 32 protein [Gillisia hiemivivida]|uniref:Glycosyltransferase n=1 Tax=Gillisia hiemivivida TaxID=291190 RepID=A0A5C6ZTY0_9FLAO|nr:glycosyltransferase [Gillisia hiemivivida]TXD93881.1 glycosyltransferase [Gillisia hiemivivida]